MAFTVKNWQDAPATATPITAVALEDMETRLSAYTDSVAGAGTGTGVSIESYGATPGGGNAAANVTAIQNAVTNNRLVVIPPGSTYDINSRIIVPGGTAIILHGTVKAVAGTWPTQYPNWPLETSPNSNSSHAMFYFRPTSGVEGSQGGMIGRGTLECNAQARYGVDIESWDFATFRDFRVSNPLEAHIHARPGPSRPDGIGTGSDCDHIAFDHLTCGYSSSGVTPFFPARGMWLRNGGANDSEISNCKLNGFEPQNPIGDVATGGWGIEIRNGGRIKIIDTYIGDNNRMYSGGVLIRTDADTTAFHERSVTIRDLYVEAGNAFDAGEVNANWICAAIKVSMAAGITTARSDGHIIDGLQFEHTGRTFVDKGKMRRLWLTNSAGAGMIKSVRYTNPRDHLNTAGQVLISANSNENLIEVDDASTGLSGEAAYIVNAGTNNYVKHTLQGGANTLLT